MRPKSLALLLLALGCGLVASIGIMKVMSRWGGESQAVATDTENILVAATDIGMGDLLTRQMFKVGQWPKDKIPVGALSKVEDLEGRRTRARLYTNVPILEDQLFAKGANQQGAGAMIPVGYRVVPVKVDLVSGGSSMILPGDRVDVMIHLVRDPSRDIRETVTRTILQDIKVFAVNDVLDVEKEKDGGKSIAAKTISLLVTPKQAAEVMLASQMGIVNLVLRSPEDSKPGGGVEVRPDELFGAAVQSHRENDAGADLPKPKETPKLVVEPVAQTAQLRPLWTVRVLKANSVDNVIFEKEGKGDANSPLGQWKAVTPTGPSTGAQPAVKETPPDSVTPPPPDAEEQGPVGLEPDPKTAKVK